MSLMNFSLMGCSDGFSMGVCGVMLAAYAFMRLCVSAHDAQRHPWKIF
jgi:hypothetical protein